MPETEQQDRTLSELVVREAVEKGMDTPLRDSIMEGVEASGEATSATGRRLPLAGALFGLGAAIGFLAGRESTDLEETPLDDIQEPEIIEDVVGDVTDEADDEPIETEDEPVETEDEGDTDADADAAESSSRLPKLLLAIGVIAGAVFLRRRLGGSDEDEWEPIEEFAPATTTGLGDDEGDEASEEPADEDAGAGDGMADGPAEDEE